MYHSFKFWINLSASFLCGHNCLRLCLQNSRNFENKALALVPFEEVHRIMPCCAASTQCMRASCLRSKDGRKSKAKPSPGEGETLEGKNSGLRRATTSDVSCGLGMTESRKWGLKTYHRRGLERKCVSLWSLSVLVVLL